MEDIENIPFKGETWNISVIPSMPEIVTILEVGDKVVKCKYHSDRKVRCESKAMFSHWKLVE